MNSSFKNEDETGALPPSERQNRTPPRETLFPLAGFTREANRGPPPKFPLVKFIEFFRGGNGKTPPEGRGLASRKKRRVKSGCPLG
jgi:hypothetical protein